MQQEARFREFLKACIRPGEPLPLEDDLRLVAGMFRLSLKEAQEIYVDMARNNGNGPREDLFPEPGEPEPPEPPEIPPNQWPGDPSSDLRLDDLGNAERLVARFGKDLRYCHPWKRWQIWDGSRWAPDDTGEVLRKAKAVARDFHLQAADARGDDLAKALTKHAHYSRSRAGIRGMVELAQSELGIPLLPEDLDADVWLLNVGNGTVDLKTGELRDNSREDLITKHLSTAYDPEAPCPTWEQFLTEIFAGNPRVLDFVQRAVGYSLTGDISEQCFFILHGSGSNGKSTFLTALRELLAEYATRTPTETLMLKRSGGIPNDLAALRGARFVTASETEDGRRLAESLIKDLTGGEAISARFLHAEFFEFTPTFKIWLATNHRPQIRGTDLAIWRRIRLIPFAVTIPPERVDRDLPEKLKAEGPGILRWALEGCLKWQREGLEPPEEVQAATEGYREEQDLIGGFLREACRENEEGLVRASELYAAFTDLHGPKVLTQQAFGKAMTERGYDRVKKRDGWYYLSLSFQG